MSTGPINSTVVAVAVRSRAHFLWASRGVLKVKEVVLQAITRGTIQSLPPKQYGRLLATQRRLQTKTSTEAI